MTALLDKLPTILVLAVLVGIFLSLRAHAPSARTRLWTYAWGLIFLHFFIQPFETHTGTVENILESIDIVALELSALVFTVSMSRAVEDRRQRLTYLFVGCIPTAFQATAAVFNWNLRMPMATALAVVFFGAAYFALTAYPKLRVHTVVIGAAFVFVGAWAVRDQWHGNSDFGITAILTIFFGICGPLFWLRYPRRSAGVLNVTGGFIAWGLVFPAGAIVDAVAPKLVINPEIWNVPKYFVAFGMVLAMLEDKSRIIEQAGQREREENQLLEQLSRITSRLLSGKDPASLCGEIASAITSASSFKRAALFLTTDERTLRLSGSDGYTRTENQMLESRSRDWTMTSVGALCNSGTRVGHNAFRLGAAHEYDDIEIVIPLTSWRGSSLGCLLLSTRADDGDVDKREVIKLEVLASDLAVTIENARLHHQLVRSEKLAALGQLVAGVAHELNNPLTGIMGYSELLAEEVEGEKLGKRVQKLGNEARRMKRIVDGLLRFARQNNPAARAADIHSALQDVIQLREYHLRKFLIDLKVETEPDLPRIAIGEDELKQVLLNILNNAIDAVEDSSDRAIRISAKRNGERLSILFEDSGPGFSDLSRAFDPFFTTKPVGKGTGLGLSICYGIVQECGGEIVISNSARYGASVTLDFPAATVADPLLALQAQ
ncbi:MAG: ATP-binding protein [Candidatus Acidiferrales bacterium]